MPLENEDRPSDLPYVGTPDKSAWKLAESITVGEGVLITILRRAVTVRAALGPVRESAVPGARADRCLGGR